MKRAIVLDANDVKKLIAEKYGLKENGVVGSATWAAFMKKAETYTITIHGVDKPEMEKMRERSIIRWQR